MPQAERQGRHFTEVREMYVEIYKVSMPCEKGAGKRGHRSKWGKFTQSM